MSMKRWPRIPPSEITPERAYLSRRRFMVGLAGAGLAAAAPPALAQQVMGVSLVPRLEYGKNSRYSTTEKLNSYKEITSYNNFYEFGTDKESPAENAHTLRPRPWSVRGR
jgi:sulfoxide reductase catalytic subunit YedY